MRWERGDDFIEISGGIDAGKHEDIWHVDTISGFVWKDLPIECREKIPKSDEEGYRGLIEVVSRWAERNGYQQVPEDDV